MPMTGTAQGFVCDDCHKLLRLHVFVGAFPTIAELAGSHDCRPKVMIRITPERTRSQKDFTAPHQPVAGRPVGRTSQNGLHTSPVSHHKPVDRTLQCQGMTLEGRHCKYRPLDEGRVNGYEEAWMVWFAPYIGILCRVHAEKASDPHTIRPVMGKERMGLAPHSN